MKNKYVNLYMVISIVIMFLVEKYWVSSYFGKSFIKIILFLILPFTINIFFKKFIKDILFRYNKNYVKQIILISFSLASLIIISYITIGRFFDFSNISSSLNNKLKINKSNFIYIAIYISLINSFIEEFFFRGLGYLNTDNSGSGVQAIISALLFSLYHIIMIDNWFNPFLFGLIILSLFIAGMIFNFIARRTNTILAPWVVHMASNIAINIIAISLL